MASAAASNNPPNESDSSFSTIFVGSLASRSFDPRAAGDPLVAPVQIDEEGGETIVHSSSEGHVLSSNFNPGVPPMNQESGAITNTLQILVHLLIPLQH